MPIANVNNIELWHETFGDKKNEALLLIMGGCCQGILWPNEFCNKLAKAGFFVIRYDHRDTGQSSYFDFNTHPYTIHDMAQDAICLLDHLSINKVHLVGLSLGAPIAELISIFDPSRVNALTLISSSCDFRPMNLGFAGLPPEPNRLSRTKEEYLHWINKFKGREPSRIEEIIQLRVEGWRILNGHKAQFDERRCYELQREFVQRARYKTMGSGGGIPT